MLRDLILFLLKKQDSFHTHATHNGKEMKYRDPQIKNINHVLLTWSYWSVDMLRLHQGLKRPVSFCFFDIAYLQLHKTIAREQ